MKSIRFIMVGGFLGAGKTTTLARLAHEYMKSGLRVGVVTNDQAEDLVDTHNLRSQGFHVAEVPGACFCCKFDELIQRAGELRDDQKPDLILAEPVGSCTDLVATVVQPLRDLHQGYYSVAPFVVLFKPSHGLRILRGQPAGFSPKAAYIFKKQLEEADAIVINRLDEIQPDELKELQSLLAEKYPNTPVLAISAKTGQGFDVLKELLAQEGHFGQKILDIDYDTYAEGEAELGWLNCSANFQSQVSFSLDELLLEVISTLREKLLSLGGEVAHLKIIGMETHGTYAVANLVSNLTAVELSLPSHAHLNEVDLIVNARVAMDPNQLEREVQQTIGQAAQTRQALVEFRKSQSLRPGRPTPTHRYSTPVNF
ncbi:MAG: cobalamin biosynthesis protein P47K [Gemmataceae bacterium]|jgi:G3E family GTPase|nr:cobalamin biosynthesis protein P47K [Gemmataceae bacterium]